MDGNRKRVASGSPYEEAFGFSRAVRVGDRVMVAGTGPVWPDGSCPDDAAIQARRVFAIIEEALAGADASLDDVVRTRMYLTDPADVDTVGRIHREVFGTALPAATMVIVAGLADRRWRVEAEAEALLSLTE